TLLGVFFVLGIATKLRKSRGKSMRLQNRVYIAGFALCLALASVCSAQTAPAAGQAAAPAAPTPPAPLSQPAITGPLSGLPPATFDAGPFGKISANGFLSGGGMVQGN